METIMDTGGINLFFMEVVGVVILFALMVWAVIRTRSKGKESSNPTTERATRELYQEEERRRKDGVDDL
jgi:lysylphosphatidylglycerol synthetase-like protein (DUF2156 family)